MDLPIDVNYKNKTGIISSEIQNLSSTSNINKNNNFNNNYSNYSNSYNNNKSNTKIKKKKIK
jgi:hypothetical protein